MDLKLQELQDSSDLVTGIDIAMEDVKQELISGITLTRVNLVGAFRSEIIAMQKKLQDEKTAAVSILTEKISKLIEEKSQMELSLELALESKRLVERQLREEKKQLELTLADKCSLIHNLRLQVDQLTAEISQERANKLVLSPATSGSFVSAEDDLGTTTAARVFFRESESTSQEKYNSCHKEGSRASTPSVSKPSYGIGIGCAEKLGPESKDDQDEYEDENGKKEGEFQPQDPLLVFTDNSQQLHQQQYFSISDSEQVRGDGEKERNPEFPTAQEKESNGSDEAELLHSPPSPPFQRWIVKIEATSPQPPENYQPKPPTLRVKLQQQEPISESTRFVDQEARVGEEVAEGENAETFGIKPVTVEFQEEQCMQTEVISPALLASSTSLSDREKDLESGIKSPSKPLTEVIDSSSPKRKSIDIDYDGLYDDILEKPISPRKTENENNDVNPPASCPISSCENQSSETKESITSPKPNSSKPPRKKKKKYSGYDRPCPASRKRKYRSALPPSSPAESSTETGKLQKTTEESLASTSNSSMTLQSLVPESDLYYRRPSSSLLGTTLLRKENDGSPASASSSLAPLLNLSPMSRRKTMTVSSSSPSPHGTDKLGKEAEETDPENVRLLSDLYYRRHEYPASSPEIEIIENDSPSLSEGSIMQVPEMHRVNYGFSNNSTLDHCPHARNFWYDYTHDSSTKYLIRFFDDKDFDKWTTRRLTIKEQVGLAKPFVFHLSFEEIVQRLKENIKNPGGIRIWLDVRDFNIFSHKVAQFFPIFGPSVTHFSLGYPLYSTEKVGSDLLLPFILKNLPNLEYLAVNDGAMKRLDTEFVPPHSVRDHSLHQLKTLRLISEGFRFAPPLVLAILFRAPVLSSVYGMPLNLLDYIEKKFGEKSPEINVSSSKLVKSVAVDRGQYSGSRPSAPYLIEIMTLQRLCPNLEELDTRVSFVSSHIAHKLILEMFSKILHLNANSLQVLKIEPSGGSVSLTFPSRLKACKTLQLDMKLKPDSNQRYFPKGMEFSNVFPNVKTVEISLEVMDKREMDKIQNSLKGQAPIELFNAHFSADAFLPPDTLKNVERLNIINFTPRDLMNKFQEPFSNITILGLNQTLAVVGQVLPECFQLWPKLKQLVLELTFSSAKGRMRNLDSAFTGISRGNCEDLRTQLKAGGPQTIQQKITALSYQINPAISNLKDLRLLKIVLLHKGRVDPKMLPDCLMTPVSDVYGFGKARMPRLNVIIGFHDLVSSKERSEIVRYLEPMKGSVTIDD